ncbi:MAG: hypothetical protein Q4Q06_00815 [Bacteroidota bacterium]|nr:hypothetical protein [Bacteroidota bacterium]
MLKRILIFLVASFCALSVFCQPPLPTHGSKNNAGNKQGCVIEIDENGNVINFPLTPATSLLLVMGATSLYYRIKRNNKNQ